MKFINPYLIGSAALFVILMSSCFTEEIQLDLNSQENKKVVIIGWLNDVDTNQYIKISYSQDYFDDRFIEYIIDASVTLSYNSEVIDLQSTNDGRYLLPPDWKGEPGTEYTLSVLHNQNEYRAVSLMNAMPEVENIRSELFIDEEDSLSYYEVFFSFQETPGEGDGYFAIDYLKNSDQKNIIRTGGWTDDEFGDGQYFADISVTENYHQLGDTIILETHSVGKQASQYFESITNEIFREGLLDPPPVNVPSNFTNGAFGYFITSGKREYEVIIE